MTNNLSSCWHKAKQRPYLITSLKSISLALHRAWRTDANLCSDWPRLVQDDRRHTHRHIMKESISLNLTSCHTACPSLHFCSSLWIYDTAVILNPNVTFYQKDSRCEICPRLVQQHRANTAEAHGYYRGNMFKAPTYCLTKSEFWHKICAATIWL